MAYYLGGLLGNRTSGYMAEQNWSPHGQETKETGRVKSWCPKIKRDPARPHFSKVLPSPNGGSVWIKSLAHRPLKDLQHPNHRTESGERGRGNNRKIKEKSWIGKKAGKDDRQCSCNQNCFWVTFCSFGSVQIMGILWMSLSHPHAAYIPRSKTDINLRFLF